MGLDVGRRRIGVALSDEEGRIASGLVSLERDDEETALLAVAALAEHYGVQKVVVGWPVRMDGTEGPEAEAVKEFVGRLRNHVSCPVVLQDERLTTRQAERALLEADMRRRRRRQVIDQTAAALILQAYLDRYGARGKDGGHAGGWRSRGDGQNEPGERTGCSGAQE